MHRPDLERWHGVIWVDCMHTDGPGLALLGRVEEAVATTVEYASALQRDDGLFQHGYDVVSGRGNDVAWGRGQAWAMLGTDRERSDTRRFRSFANGLLPSSSR